MFSMRQVSQSLAQIGATTFANVRKNTSGMFEKRAMHNSGGDRCFKRSQYDHLCRVCRTLGHWWKAKEECNLKMEASWIW